MVLEVVREIKLVVICSQMLVELTNGFLPRRATVGSAAYDVYATENMPCNPGIHTMNLGFKVQIPNGHFLLLKSRSSLALKGMQVIAGVIDEDYRKEIVLAFELSSPMIFKRGDRIAQMILIKYYAPDLVEGKVSENGRGGFGSTGSGKI